VSLKAHGAAVRVHNVDNFRDFSKRIFIARVFCQFSRTAKHVRCRIDISAIPRLQSMLNCFGKLLLPCVVGYMIVNTSRERLIFRPRCSKRVPAAVA